MISFLFKSAFWLGLMIMLLPVEAPQDEQTVGSLTVFDAMTVAGSTVNDLSEFCTRNEAACEAGRNAASVFAYKAKHAANMLNEMVNGDTAGSQPSPYQPIPAAIEAQQTEVDDQIAALIQSN